MSKLSIPSVCRSVVITLGVLSLWPADAKSATPPRQRGSLSAEQVAALEKALEAKPESIEERARLLDHYMRTQYQSPESRRARQRHILWVIEHNPTTDLAGPRIGLNKQIDGDAYETGKQLWLNHVKAQPANTAVLNRAAEYLLLSDRDMAEQLWQKAETLEPKNPRWPERLAHLYNLSTRTRTGIDTSAAGKALDAMERAHVLARGSDFNHFIELARLAFTAGELEKAREYADELLRRAPDHAGAWNYGNAIHDGNVVLGRIALREGKVDAAKERLRTAGKTPGSPQLNSFGPTMTLAAELLERGEKETVLAYFNDCRVFWKSGGTRLDAWTSALTEGRPPDFGPNLRH